MTEAPVDLDEAAALDLDQPFTDEDLAALALAADPDAPMADDAVCLWDLDRADADPLLPEWYMPSGSRGTNLPRGWRRRVVMIIIISFLAIAASGLCSTYGQIVIA